MKAFLIVLLLTVAVYLGISWFFPLLLQGPKVMDLKRQGKQDGAGQAGRQKRRDPINLHSLSGSEVFSPEEQTTAIDGQLVRYTAAYTWCASLEPGEGQSFHIRDLRILFNQRPRTLQDLARLVRVDDTLSPDRLGNEILRLMKKGSGVRAARALFVGGKDLLTARQVVLSGGVTVFFKNRNKPEQWAILTTPELTLFFKEGSPERAAGEGPFRLVTHLGTLEGVGLELDRAASRLVVKKNVTIRGLHFQHSTLKPLDLDAQGPLVYLGKRRDGGSFLGFGEPARITVAGDVFVKQPALSLQAHGEHLLLETGGQPLDLTHLQLEEDAWLASPAGRIKGSLVTYRLQASGKGTIEVSGSPVTLTLTGGTRLLPGASGGADLLATISGPVRLEIDPKRLLDQPLDVLAGPGVLLEGSGNRVQAANMELWLEAPVKRSKAALEVPPPAGLSPRRVLLTGGVAGQGPAGSFTCRSLFFEHREAASQQPARETLRLRGQPTVLWKMGPEQGAGGLSPGAALLARVLKGGGLLEVKARDELKLLRDPFRMRPLKIEARGDVRVRRLEGKRLALLASLSGEEVDLAILPHWRPRLFTTQGPGTFQQGWRLTRAEARRRVRLSLEDSLEGEGQHLVYEEATEILSLEGDGGGKPAAILFRDANGRQQKLMARHIESFLPLGRAVAQDRVAAALWLPSLKLLRARQKHPLFVSTSLHGARLEVTLVAGKKRPGGGTPGILQHILLDAGVRVEQADARLSCAFLEADFGARNLHVRGAPARLDILDEKLEVQEFLQARQILARWREEQSPSGRPLLQGEALFKEQVVLQLLTKRGALNLGAARGAAGRPGTKPPRLVPVLFTTPKEVFLTRTRILLAGGGHVAEGDPRQEGFDLRSRRMVLFLIPSPPGKRSRGLSIYRAAAQGEAHFDSQNLVAAGEKLVLDVPHHVIMLESLKSPVSLFYGGQAFPPMPGYLLDTNRGTVESLEPHRMEGTRR